MKRPLPSHTPGSIRNHPGRGQRAASYRSRAHSHHARGALMRRAAVAPTLVPRGGPRPPRSGPSGRRPAGQRVKLREVAIVVAHVVHRRAGRTVASAAADRIGDQPSGRAGPAPKGGREPSSPFGRCNEWWHVPISYRASRPLLPTPTATPPPTTPRSTLRSPSDHQEETPAAPASGHYAPPHRNVQQHR